jgi:hypothetical protein
MKRTLARSSSFDLDSRRPVWSALSELFLDTSLDSGDLNRIAGTLASSPYSLEELDQILLWEVYPACRGNLLSMAGEWAGFDPGWLESRILRGPSPGGRFWAGTVGRIGMFSSLSWRRIKQRVEAERTSPRLRRIDAERSP